MSYKCSKCGKVFEVGAIIQGDGTVLCRDCWKPIKEKLDKTLEIAMKVITDVKLGGQTLDTAINNYQTDMDAYGITIDEVKAKIGELLVSGGGA